MLTWILDFGREVDRSSANLDLPAKWIDRANLDLGG